MPKFLITVLATSSLTVPLAASNAERFDVPQQVAAALPERADYARFAPAPERRDHRLDWQHWNEALGWLVIPMGPSLRQGAPRVDPGTGTRRIYGHESRLRLEGNKVAFSYITPEIKAALGEYRADLERIGTELEIARLPRNEQLAYWLNLHNVAMIEALARAYPLGDLTRRTFGPDKVGLDDNKLVTVAGIALSLRDIREKIVYPNWRDPKVIYGFWRGMIGGPSIPRLAFTGENVDQLLSLSGEEFVNSLRGVDAWGSALRVSPVYAEAAPFFFSDDAALHGHLRKFAGETVAGLLRKHERIRYSPLASDIADLSRGERDPSINFVCPQSGIMAGGGPPIVGVGNCATPNTIVNPAIQRLITERNAKLETARRKGIRTGMVIYADGQYNPDAPVREVE